MTFSEFLKRTIFAVFLGLLFGVFAMAGGVVVARYTGLWELWEENREAAAIQENTGERQNGLYETPKVELPESGRLQRTLPEEQAETIRLRYYGDKSFQEIADIFGVALSTAKSRFRYGMEKIKQGMMPFL